MTPVDDSDPVMGETLAQSPGHAAEPCEERYCPTCDRSYLTNESLCPNDGTNLARIARQPTLSGLVIDDRFTIQDRIGDGGMGTVYRAIQHSMGRPVAIKVIHPHLAKDAHIVKRFLRESKLTSRFTHPNTITVLDTGQTESGLLYMVMELLEGRTLEQLISDSGYPSLQRGLSIVGQVCDALIAAHDKNIIHRDLKPANIFLLANAGDRDLVKVLDFGLAKSFQEDETALTNSNMMLGTPRYLPPEMALGQVADTRSDLYSLGIILYELSSGASPFDSANANGQIYQHAHVEPRPLPDSVPETLRSVIGRLLRKNPADRVPSARALKELLQACDESITRAKTAEVTAPAPSGDGETRESSSPHVDAVLHQASSIPSVVAEESRSARRASAKWLAAALVCIVVAGGYALFARTRGGAQGEREGAPGAGSSAAPASAAASVARPTEDLAIANADAGIADALAAAVVPAPTAGSRIIDFRSKPDGAQVIVKGQQPCSTPCQLSLPISDRPVSVDFRKRGYATVHRTLDLNAEGSLDVVLERRKSRPNNPSGPGADPDEDFMTQ